MGEDGVVSYLQVGERERANALTLITREREKDEKVRHLRNGILLLTWRGRSMGGK
jgi:hypothetical protein